MDYLNYISMLLFVLLGQFGPAYLGSSWVPAYYISALVTACVFILFGIVNRKPRVFLVSALLYLTSGSLFIIFDYTSGYKLYADFTASIFFVIYLCVHILQYLLPKVSDEVLEKTAPYPLISLPLYACLVVITYALRDYPAYLSAAIPFLVIRVAVAKLSQYFEKRKS